jgi:hypothetical protein
MALNVNNLDAQVANAAGPILSALPGQSITFLKVTATNTDTAPQTLTLYRVPNGGSAATSNIMAASALALGAGETVQLPMSGQSLVNEQGLWAVSSANDVVNLNIGFASSP